MIQAADPEQLSLFPEIKIRSVRRGPKTGTRPVNARWDEPTKVVRVPRSWDMAELAERLELLQSALSSVEQDLTDARARSRNGLSNRFEHLAQFVQDLRTIMPKGDTYDLFKE